MRHQRRTLADIIMNEVILYGDVKGDRQMSLSPWFGSYLVLISRVPDFLHWLHHTGGTLLAITATSGTHREIWIRLDNPLTAQQEQYLYSLLS